MDAHFHPLIDAWFADRFSQPTDVQARAWPRIAAGEHLLITAPTGSGKTLTAFLWAINQFVTGELATGTTRILYISPLKALNNDIRRNLLEPLEALRARFDAAGKPFPDIRVQTRSGDTEPAERRRMVRQPPEILITTPESLNLMLSSSQAAQMLAGLETVILDEIHGVADNKRGTYLLSAVERLVPIAGEFQRVALSATVTPLDAVARAVAGYQREGDRYRPRPIETIRATDARTYSITVRYPDAAANRPDDEKIWESLAPDLVDRIGRNRSTLIFTNSRALCESLTWKINEAAGHLLAYAHHGSLSREVRFEVEQKMKAGELAAIVATSTLEMGIDIGSLDEVVLIQSPDSISSSIQRIGRAGHQVGATSRATVYPTHPLDFVEAATLSRAVMERDLEPVHLVSCPLDVLAQVIVSMTSTETRELDDLYAELRCAEAFQPLSRRQFDLVIDMLAGRYAGEHIRELRPKLTVDRLENSARARKGATMSLYFSGGVIPDRGYFQLRHEQTNARIGELDEEFVWEASVGKVFAFGTQTWQVKKITQNEVVVAPGNPGSVPPPFWKAEPLNRNFHYASRVGEFLEYADGRVDDDAFTEELMADYAMDSIAAAELHKLLRRQREHTGTALPHRHHLLVERIRRGPIGAAGTQIVLHTGWGSRVNRPLALALEAGWEAEFGEMPEVFVTNEALVVQLHEDMPIDALLAMAPAERIEERLRDRLEGSGFFGARFRENAGRALLLSKGRFGERKPLWMSRLQSGKLLDAVMKYDDFPLVLETWRTCLHDEFDLGALRAVLGEIVTGEIAVSEAATSAPSPFASGVAWDQVNTYMYMDDTPKAGKRSKLAPGLLEEAVFDPNLRPPIPLSLKVEFEAKRQRETAGYEPETGRDVEEWVKERSMIPGQEWRWEDMDVRIERLETGEAGLWVAAEDAERVSRIVRGEGDALETATLVGNWLQYYGPLRETDMTRLTGIPANALTDALSRLAADQVLISGRLIRDSAELWWCDAANFESLLRIMRRAARPAFEARPAGDLPAFLYAWQINFQRTRREDRLLEVIDRLRNLPQPAALWETDVLPARLHDYDPRDLDALFQEGQLIWMGRGARQVMFTFRDDLELLAPASEPFDDKLSALMPDAAGRYDFGALHDRTEMTAARLGDALWQGVWAGQLTNDTVTALRKGIDTGFRVPDVGELAATRRRSARRGAFGAWRGAIPFSGSWYRVPSPPPAEDLIEQQELLRDRVRVLLDRYGILFRELLLREADEFSWRTLFRAIRLMELSGELLAGHFFSGIPGLQFISPAAFRLLERGRFDTIFWISAADPVSPCGLGLDGVSGLPRRIPTSHLVYDGTELVLVSERSGKALTFLVPPDHERLERYLDVLRHLRHRHRDPIRQLTIETINDEAALASPYLDILANHLDLNHDHKAVYVS